MTKVRNYLGQLRLYSLVDLIMMMLAFEFRNTQVLGAILMWCGFLILLESQHRHPNRLRFWDGTAGMLMAIGLGVFDQRSVGAQAFIVLSLLYCFKNRKNWALVSPFIRGLQTAALIWSNATWPMLVLASSAIAIRNLLGDARDTSKDRRENMLTWPVLFNWSDHKHAHLIAVMATSTLWWVIGDLNPILLVEAWIIQLLSYRLTPR